MQCNVSIYKALKSLCDHMLQIQACIQPVCPSVLTHPPRHGLVENTDMRIRGHADTRMYRYADTTYINRLHLKHCKPLVNLNITKYSI